MTDQKKDRDGWGMAVTISALFNLALLGLMAWMHAHNPQHTQIAAVRIAFLPESEPVLPANRPAARVPKPRRLLPETPTPPAAEASHAELALETAPAESPAPTLNIQPLHRLSQAPRFLQRLDPVYPEAERASGREAQLVVEVVVDTRGRVLEATIVKSGGPHFDRAALDAVRQSLFVPGYIGSQSVVVRFQIPFRFHLR